jgi:hypothetical protein
MSSDRPPGFAFTLLSLADAGRVAVKTLIKLGDGAIASTEYDRGFEWWMKPFDAGTDPNRMVKTLRALAQAPRLIVCMGAPRPGLDLNQPHQRLWARSDPSENTMVEVRRAWIAIDVDDAAVPHGYGDPDRYVEGATYICDHVLPEEFHSATTIVSPTARTGLRGPELLRCRLWFLLDRPYPLPTLKTWTRGLKAVCGVGDSAIAQVGQPIYTGRPKFVGMDDPIPPLMWASMVRGRRVRAALVAERFAPAVAEIDRAMASAFTSHRGDWRGFLEETVGGPTSFFEPLSKGLGLAARSNDPDSAVIDFTLALIKRRADPSRVDQYDRQWVARSLKRFRDRDSISCAAAFGILYGEEEKRE